MKKGFTLVEILVSIAALGLISVALSQSFAAITRANTKADLVKDIKQSGDFANRRLEQMIRESVSIGDCSGGTSKELTLINRDSYQTILRCQWDDDNKIARLASVSGTQEDPPIDYLTGTNVTLGGATSCDDAEMSLVFTCSNISGDLNSVQVYYSLFQASQIPGQGNRSQQAHADFQTTINTRNY